MKKIIPFWLILGACALLSACGDETVKPQQSPCVGLDDSPCGPKRAVNKDVV